MTRSMKKPGVLFAGLVSGALVLSACSGGGDTPVEGAASGDAATGSSGDVTLELIQWWEPELPEGELRDLMDEFEDANPGIKVELLSGPYGSIRDQVVASAATGTMPDVVGLDGAWVYDFAKQGAIADLDQIITEFGGDSSDYRSIVQVDGKSYSINAVNFAYPMMVNADLLEQAGITELPSNRTEFKDAATKISGLGSNISGWAIPLNTEQPSGVQNNFMSWVWASGGSMMKDGKPDLTNPEVTSATQFIVDLWQDGSTAPGAFTMKEQDMVEEFINGRVGMMIDSLAHLTMIKEGAPDMNLQFIAVPAEDDYTGTRGMDFASWGIGISENSEHKAEAWKLVEFLMSKDGNEKLANMANAFPGNAQAKPAAAETNPLVADAFEIWNESEPMNEFTGLPVAEELMRRFSQQLQLAMDGSQTVEESLKNAQSSWEGEFE